MVVTPYNLHPDMCMTTPYMFLTCIIPGLSNPKNKIDVFLQPLIDELRTLWDGVQTYDISMRQNFLMRAALMWIVNDFLALGMLSGWSTHGVLSCPVCMDQLRATHLKYGVKASWFDCHCRFLPRHHAFRKNHTAFCKGKVVKEGPPSRRSGEELWNEVRSLPKVTTDGDFVIPGFKENVHNWTKRSIFWDLPYWKDQLLHRNLDVMHIEKNLCDNIINTIMDVPRKTKDDVKPRLDMVDMCDRAELNVERGVNRRTLKPKASYVLSLDKRKGVCEWAQRLTMPDAYCSNFGNCVDMKAAKFQNMKSHDCHVFL